MVWTASLPPNGAYVLTWMRTADAKKAAAIRNQARVRQAGSLVRLPGVLLATGGV